MHTVAGPLLHVLAYALLFAAVIGFCCWPEFVAWCKSVRDDAFYGGPR